MLFVSLRTQKTFFEVFVHIRVIMLNNAVFARFQGIFGLEIE